MTNPRAEHIRPTEIDGASGDVDATPPDAEERLDTDPAEEPSFPETHPGTPLVEGVVEEPTSDEGADRLAPLPPGDDANG